MDSETPKSRNVSVPTTSAMERREGTCVARPLLMALACFLTHGVCSGLASTVAVMSPSCPSPLLAPLLPSPGTRKDTKGFLRVAPVRDAGSRRANAAAALLLDALCGAAIRICPRRLCIMLQAYLRCARYWTRSVINQSCVLCEQPARPHSAVAWASGAQSPSVGQRGNAEVPFSLCYACIYPPRSAWSRGKITECLCRARASRMRQKEDSGCTQIQGWFVRRSAGSS